MGAPLSPDGYRSIRARILDAALAAFVERGPRATTLSLIAERAGVSRPTVYKHVGDGAAITAAVVERELARFFADLALRLADPAQADVLLPTGDTREPDVRPLARGVREPDRPSVSVTDPERRVVDAVVFAVHHAREHPLLQRLLDLEPEVILPVFTVAAAPVLRRAIDALQPAIEDVDRVARSRARLAPAPVRAELLARTTISLVVTPPVAADLRDPVLVRSLVAALLRMPDADQPQRG